MDTGIAFAAVTTRNEGVKVTGKLGFSSHPMIEHFKFVKAKHAENDHSGAVGTLRTSGRNSDRQIRLSEARYIL